MYVHNTRVLVLYVCTHRLLDTLKMGGFSECVKYDRSLPEHILEVFGECVPMAFVVVLGDYIRMFTSGVRQLCMFTSGVR